MMTKSISHATAYKLELDGTLSHKNHFDSDWELTEWACSTNFANLIVVNRKGRFAMFSQLSNADMTTEYRVVFADDVENFDKFIASYLS